MDEEAVDLIGDALCIAASTNTDSVVLSVNKVAKNFLSAEPQLVCT